MSQPIRYVLNMETGTLHDRRHLTENCNTDQIVKRMKFTTDDLDEARQHLAFRKRCHWCKPIVLRNPDTQEVPDAAPAP